MSGFSFGEIAVVIIVAIVIWGDKFPQMARKAARLYSELRRYMNQVRDEVMRHVPDEREIMGDDNPLPPSDQMPVYMDPSDPDYKGPPALPESTATAPSSDTQTQPAPAGDSAAEDKLSPPGVREDTPSADQPGEKGPSEVAGQAVREDKPNGHSQTEAKVSEPTSPAPASPPGSGGPGPASAP